MSRCAMDGGGGSWDESSGVDISISRGASGVQKVQSVPYVRFFSFLFPSFLFLSPLPPYHKNGNSPAACHAMRGS